MRLGEIQAILGTPSGCLFLVFYKVWVTFEQFRAHFLGDFLRVLGGVYVKSRWNLYDIYMEFSRNSFEIYVILVPKRGQWNNPPLRMLL